MGVGQQDSASFLFRELLLEIVNAIVDIQESPGELDFLILELLLNEGVVLLKVVLEDDFGDEQDDELDSLLNDELLLLQQVDLELWNELDELKVLLNNREDFGVLRDLLDDELLLVLHDAVLLERLAELTEERGLLLQKADEVPHQKSNYMICCFLDSRFATEFVQILDEGFLVRSREEEVELRHAHSEDEEVLHVGHLGHVLLHELHVQPDFFERVENYVQSHGEFPVEFLGVSILFQVVVWDDFGLQQKHGLRHDLSELLAADVVHRNYLGN